MLAVLIGCWMLQDFKRIKYSSRYRYVYLVLCMLIQPLFFVYLLRTRVLRRVAGKPALFTQRAVPVVVLCLLLWYQFLSSFPIAEMRRAQYQNTLTPEEAKAQAVQAKEFLKAAGMDTADCDWMNGNIALYLQENLDSTARLIAKGQPKEYGPAEGSSLTGNTSEKRLPKIRVNTWLFYIGEAKWEKELYAAVTCFSWEGKSVLQQGEFTIQLENGFEMDGRHGFFRLWADGKNKSYYQDCDFSDISFDSNSFEFYGKSLLQKYAWHGCVVTYFRGQEVPEYVTLTFRQQVFGPSGQELFVYSGDCRFE
ncbi:MAG: hypothetical protein K2N94_06645 [Lachnospiraceae bacterium]|nr:hypothetical protein [Lachnospiraceae bacterium]